MKNSIKTTRPLKSYDLKKFTADEIWRMTILYLWNKFRLSSELLKAQKENRVLKEALKQLKSQVLNLQTNINTSDQLFSALNEICDEQRAMINRLHEKSGNGMPASFMKQNPRLRIVT